MTEAEFIEIMIGKMDLLEERLAKFNCNMDAINFEINKVKERLNKRAGLLNQSNDEALNAPTKLFLNQVFGKS